MGCWVLFALLSRTVPAKMNAVLRVLKLPRDRNKATCKFVYTCVYVDANIEVRRKKLISIIHIYL